MTYEIEGRLLEVCTCNVLCPCWVGEDPDYTTCDTTIAWGIEKGSIDGVRVDASNARFSGGHAGRGLAISGRRGGTPAPVGRAGASRRGDPDWRRTGGKEVPRLSQR